VRLLLKLSRRFSRCIYPPQIVETTAATKTIPASPKDAGRRPAGFQPACCAAPRFSMRRCAFRTTGINGRCGRLGKTFREPCRAWMSRPSAACFAKYFTRQKLIRARYPVKRFTRALAPPPVDRDGFCWCDRLCYLGGSYFACYCLTSNIKFVVSTREHAKRDAASRRSDGQRKVAAGSRIAAPAKIRAPFFSLQKRPDGQVLLLLLGLVLQRLLPPEAPQEASPPSSQAS
jgi:hypothetical protein